MKKLIVWFMALGLFILAGCASTPTQEVTYDPDSWKTEIAASCQIFFDGCNQCMRLPHSDEAGCTKMFCETYAQPYCMDEEIEVEVIEKRVIENEASNNGDDDEFVDREVEMEAQREEAMQYASSYIWLTVEQAQDFAVEHNMSFRVVEEDGEGLAVTMDYRPGRINATVENGIVVSVDVE